MSSAQNQTIVDRDATAEEAAAIGERVLAWLVSRQIVEGTVSPCLVGDPKLGYAPGANMERWVDASYNGGPDTRAERVNGLELVTEKTVFWSINTDYEAVCPHGDAHSPDGDWIKVIDEWWSETGPALLECPVCGQSYSIIDWSFEPGFAFGYLGFRFWNWPEFWGQPLLEELGRLLAPHRVVLVLSSVY